MSESQLPLLAALREPASVLALGASEWNELLTMARRRGVLARLGLLLQEQNLIDRVPGKARDRFLDARRLAEWNQTRLRFEVNRLLRALADLDVDLTLLKGAAYLLADLPAARGRMASDLDIMVPRERLEAVERAMTAAGWTHVKTDAYDQHYYRTWMHELPPLVHPARNMVTDVHHSIVPVTSRLKPDVAALLQAAQPLQNPRLKVLEPADMVLHGATHLFYDSELVNGLRDLVDLDCLLRHFGQREHFWVQLSARTKLHKLGRPLYYLFRYSRRYLATPIPDSRWAAVQADAPTPAVRFIMDRLVNATVGRSPDPGASDGGLARRLLSVHAHLIRMPPALLVRHLVIKNLQGLRRSR